MAGHPGQCSKSKGVILIITEFTNHMEVHLLVEEEKSLHDCLKRQFQMGGDAVYLDEEQYLPFPSLIINLARFYDTVGQFLVMFT